MQNVPKTLPAGKSAYKRLHPKNRILVDDLVQRLTGLEWGFTLRATVPIYDFTSVEIGTEMRKQNLAKMTKRQMASGDLLSGTLVAALIEKVGGPDNECTDACQAALYRLSARRDHKKAAQNFIANSGDEEQFRQAIANWLDRHEQELTGFSLGLRIMKLPLGKIEAYSPAEIFDYFEKETRKVLLQRGAIEPMAVACEADSTATMFAMPRKFNSEQERQEFGAVVDDLKAQFTRVLMVSEAWAVVNPSAEIRPSQSERRQEIIIMTLTEGVATCARTYAIDREFGSGKVKLGVMLNSETDLEIVPGEDDH